MATTVITTIEQGPEQVFEGGSLLITGTGGFIDSDGDGLGFVSTGGQPLGTVTIEAGALVFGDGNGIDYTGTNSSSQFVIDGTVQGNAIGMNLVQIANSSSASDPTITIGTQGSVSGGSGAGISLDTTITNITNHGLIGGSAGILIGDTNATAYILNTGTIDGAVQLDQTGYGDETANIANTGTIDGELQFEQSGQVVVNDSGTIESNSNYGIYVQDGTSVSLTVNGDVTGDPSGITALRTTPRYWRGRRA